MTHSFSRLEGCFIISVSIFPCYYNCIQDNSLTFAEKQQHPFRGRLIRPQQMAGSSSTPRTLCPRLPASSSPHLAFLLSSCSALSLVYLCPFGRNSAGVIHNQLQTHYTFSPCQYHLSLPAPHLQASLLYWFLKCMWRSTTTFISQMLSVAVDICLKGVWAQTCGGRQSSQSLLGLVSPCTIVL